ncbi:recombinase family protein [Gammaproteobacteria bacterium]|jgi:DNA invertase Pin-like site-specific DNA recombinase|nr:recombinase family protein [Gammaproteobacteria bacterium]
MKKAYGYSRVSTKKQEQHGYSLEAQKEQIENYCKRNGYELIGFEAEAESGTKADRPLLEEALNICQLADATLIVAKIDRLTRDLHFLTGLQNKGIKFLALDMPEANESMLQIMITFAQMENKLRSKRVKEGMRKAKEKGKKFGTPSNLSTYFEKLENQVDPKGRRWEIRKELEALSSGKPISPKTKEELLKEESEIIEKINLVKAKAPTVAREEQALARAKLLKTTYDKCVAEGHTSLNQLAKCFTEKGIETPSGLKVWNKSHIQTFKKQLVKLEKE